MERTSGNIVVEHTVQTPWTYLELVCGTKSPDFMVETLCTAGHTTFPPSCSPLKFTTSSRTSSRLMSSFACKYQALAASVGCKPRSWTVTVSYGMPAGRLPRPNISLRRECQLVAGRLELK